jgi:hypothetical protein
MINPAVLDVPRGDGILNRFPLELVAVVWLLSDGDSCFESDSALRGTLSLPSGKRGLLDSVVSSTHCVMVQRLANAIFN